MKKFVAMMLALLLVLANVAALAEGDKKEPETPNFEPLRQQSKSGQTPSFQKMYVEEAVTADSTPTAATVFPKETLKFTVVAGTNPDTTAITVGTGSTTESGTTYCTYVVADATSTITVNVPAADTEHFTKPGKYTYTVTEVAGNTEGMLTYDTKPITVDVYVVYDTDTTSNLTDTKVLGTNVYTSVASGSGSKTDTLYNVYQVGNLTVGKTTTGNLADKSLPFTFEVVFTPTGAVLSDITIASGNTANAYNSATLTTAITKIEGDGWNTAKTIYVKAADGQSLKFENIPAGVTYTVTETKAGEKSITKLTNNDETTQLTNANDSTAYYVTGEVSDSTAIKAKADDTVTVTNNKEIKIPTGITLETLPYVLILAVAAMGITVLVIRKKKEY